MSFWLDNDPAARLRLKSFSATATSGKSTIRIVLETDDPYELGDALRRLADVQKGQRAKAPAKPKTPPLLALPAPEDQS